MLAMLAVLRWVGRIVLHVGIERERQRRHQQHRRKRQ
jgi:hypothetical protein